MKIKKVVIVGGGTAGWLAANHLGSELCSDKEIEITLIESDVVPTIGVGEGTVPYIIRGLRRFGISEVDLLCECDATFKQGIKFVNWLDENRHGKNYYYHPFDVPFPSGFDVTPYWVSHAAAHTRYDGVGIQARICEQGLAPKRKSSGEYEGDLAYAYHFNAKKFADLLSRNAQKRFGVKRKVITISSVKKDSAGYLSHLVTDGGDELEFDFYIDCSGFSSILIEKELGVPFICKSKELLANTALVHQVPISECEPINPFTTATAHKAGWIWDIPLTNRRGTGFVYSSNYIEDEEAHLLYAQYLCVDAHSFAPRKIDMRMGYRKEFWHKNCVSLGLSQGFLEPLEATSILLTDFTAGLFARNFPRFKDDMDSSINYCNKVVDYAWARTVDFIKLHYCISDRVDSDFWIDNKDPKSLSDTLKERLALWKRRSPQKMDFFSRFELFDAENFLYVLYGMKYQTAALPLTQEEFMQSAALISNNDVLIERVSTNLLKHREWLDGLKAAVSRKI